MNEFNYTDSKPLRDKVDEHFKLWIDFIKTRLVKFAPSEKVEVLVAQLLSLITGAPIIALVSGSPDVALFDKKTAEDLLNEL